MGSIESFFVSYAHNKMKLTFAIVISLVNVSFFSSAQGKFTEDQIDNLAFNLLNPCERAIWSCCQGEGTNFAQPTFCFERNGCFGLEGLGRKACSARLINSIGVTLESTRDQIRRKAPNQDGGFIRIHNTRPKK